MAFSTIGIVGSGPAGCSVALACAIEGFPVILVRAFRSDVEAIRTRIAQRLGIAVERGALRTEDRERVESRLVLTGDLRRCADADLVIDASRCDLRSRRAMLATLESRLSSGAVLATSAPPEQLEPIAEVLRRPDQFVGMRVLPHDAIDVRVELSMLPETAPGVVAACRAFVSRLGRTALERDVQPAPIGYREFIFNRA